jgi:predicted Zn-dependent protease
MQRTAIALLLGAWCTVAVADDTPPPLIEVMASELDYSMANLAHRDGTKPYYLAYTINDIASETIVGQLGALYDDDASRLRILDVDVRVGDYSLDNTHKIRGQGSSFGGGFGSRSGPIGLDDNEQAIRHALWRATDRQFKSAVEKYQQVQTNVKTMVEEDEKAADFSRETPSVFIEADAELSIDHEAWAKRIRSVSEMALDYPLIYSSSVALGATAENRYMVSSEGTRLKTQRKLLRVALTASTKADDGMDLSQTYIFSTATEEGLPSEEDMRAAFQGVIDMALALREAPLVEPYTGPAILMNRASGVFFHEIFGHRIEGHRQKDVDEGQTFTKMVGKPILPEFISVSDDPTTARFDGEDLRGFYRYDDEGVPAARVNLVDQGVLRTFLLSRSPVPGFDKSNGHGRRSPGNQSVSRQGNLMVHSTNAVEFDELRAMLIEECKAQNKEYGFLFEDITGGFTTTSRGGPQAFKVLPVVVYRVYTDGRPDELVRGVDIVGTPLSCFSQIICTGDEPATFNGTCGAESGWVPVSAISPSILVRQIEIEKRQRSQDRPPLLLPPIAGGQPTASAEVNP